MHLMQMAHETDPASDIIQKLGNIDDIDLLHNQIMVAVYIRPEKTKSGIYLSDNTRQEDRYQGKVGLLVKKGPTAFEADDKWFSGEENFTVNLDWLVFRPSDSWQITVNGVLCRIMDDIAVRGRVPNPDMVY